jgi:hypothetical protein
VACRCLVPRRHELPVSSLILTITWGTQILASDLRARSYDRRTVSVRSGFCGAQTASALPTNGRLTEALQGQYASVWGRALNGGACQMRTFNVRRFPSLSNFDFLCLWGGPKQNTSTQNTSTVNRFEASPRQDGWEPTASPANSRECQTYTEEYASDVSPQGRIPRSAGTPCNSILHSAAPCESYRARVRRIALNAD